MADKTTMNAKQLDKCILKIADGDKLALTKLYDSFRKPVFLFSLSMVKDYSLAEDVSQETFVRILAYAGTYRPGTNPRAWIFKIARNLASRAIKLKHLEISTDDEILSKTADENSGAENSAACHVLEAFGILDETEQTIVSLYLFGGFKQTEIAKILSLPYNHVHSKYSYAIKKLRKVY